MGYSCYLICSRLGTNILFCTIGRCLPRRQDQLEGRVGWDILSYPQSREYSLEVSEGPLRIAAEVSLSFLRIEGEEAGYGPLGLFSIEHIALGIPLRRQDSGNGVPKRKIRIDNALTCLYCVY